MVAPLLITGLKSLSLMHKSAIENLFKKLLLLLRPNIQTPEEVGWKWNDCVQPPSVLLQWRHCTWVDVSKSQLSSWINLPDLFIWSASQASCGAGSSVCLKTATCYNAYTQAHTRARIHTWNVLTGSDGSVFAASQNFTLPTCFFFFSGYPALACAWWESASFCNAHTNHHIAVIRIAPNVHRQQLTTSLQLYRQ